MPLIIHLDEATKAQLDAVALSLSSTPETVVKQVVDSYLENDAKFRSDVEAGLVSAVQDDLYPADEVEREFSSLRADYLSKAGQ